MEKTCPKAHDRGGPLEMQDIWMIPAKIINKTAKHQFWLAVRFAVFSGTQLFIEILKPSF